MPKTWQLKLAEYIAESAHFPVVPGSHDCLTFTNGAAHAITGKGFADDWLGAYIVDGRLLSHTELQALFGFRRLHLALNARLRRIDEAVEGSLVGTHRAAYPSIGTRLALGVSLGDQLVYLGGDGLVRVLPTEFDYAWELG